MVDRPYLKIDSDVPPLLRRLLEQFNSGCHESQRDTMHLIGVPQLLAPETIVGALCLGGIDFAAYLAAQRDPSLAQAEHHQAVIDAFLLVTDPPQHAVDDPELRTAEWLVQAFGLSADPASLINILRAELMIVAGPLEEVPKAALAAMVQSRWDLSLRGFMRCQTALKEKTPRDIYGLAAMCLHKLGRYEEADQWVAQGLGDQQALLAIGPVHTEAELFRQWSGRRSPVISIICATYNHERYIESAIRGFLSQNCSLSFEVLIHDDASTDGTQQIIKNWQKQYPNVIKPVLQQENQWSKGGRPFELLLARSRGQFVAVCEGDDFWIDPGKLQRQVGFLKANPRFSCSAHNYYHFQEALLSVRPWTAIRHDHVLSQAHLMGVSRLLWLPTLVFRKTFSALPPERAMAPIGDQFITSYLGTLGDCMYFESMFGAVRRENEFSSWSPLSNQEKETMRVKTWQALVQMHERMGNKQAVIDLMSKISASPLSHVAKVDPNRGAGFPPDRQNSN